MPGAAAVAGAGAGDGLVFAAAVADEGSVPASLEEPCFPLVAALGGTAALPFAGAVVAAAAAVCFSPLAAMAFKSAALASTPSAAFAFAVAWPVPPVVAWAIACEFERDGFDVGATWPEPEAELPAFAAEALVGAALCCVVVCGAGGLAGRFADGLVAVWDGLGGADVPASSNAAKGCELGSWLGVDGCIRDGDARGAAAGKSDAILGILDTR